MIPILLRDLRWRLASLALLGLLIYFLEPAFHQHDAIDPRFAGEAGPLGVSASLAYLAALSMIVLLGGFISTDRREGYNAILFSYPTSPLALYGLRFALALGAAVLAAALFLIVGQLVAWGEFRGGAGGIVLALLAALVYGSLMAFFSSVMKSGEAWVVLLLFLPTPVPAILTLLQSGLPGPLYDLLVFLLPPQHALQEVYRSLILGGVAWPPVLYALGYALVWLTLCALNLRHLRAPA